MWTGAVSMLPCMRRPSSHFQEPKTLLTEVEPVRRKEEVRSLSWDFVPVSRPDTDRRNWTWHQGPGPADGPAVVFDIDGVLSDAAGRQQFLERGRREWAAFFVDRWDD